MNKENKNIIIFSVVIIVIIIFIECYKIKNRNESPGSDPEGMIYQHLVLGASVSIYMFLIGFYLLFTKDWTKSLIFMLISSICIITYLTHITEVNKKLGYGITNLLTFPLMAPLLIFKPNNPISTIIASSILLLSSPFIIVYGTITSLLHKLS